MDQLEKASRLRNMLKEISPQDDLESLRPVGGDAANESLGEQTRQRRYPPSFGVADAVTGLDKLKQGRDADLSPAEMMGLEAIVMRENRPVVFVRNGSYDTLGGIWANLDGAAAKQRIDPLLGAIGRIELPNMPSLPYGGTGFLVGPSLLMTNRHVARLFAEGLGVTRLLYRPGDAAVDFRREAATEADNSSHFTIEAVLMVHPHWDMALVRVAGLSPAYGHLTMSVLAPDKLVDRNVVVVGYPARDDRSDLALQDHIFQGVYNVKRLQPGTIRPRLRVTSFGHPVEALVHNSSTLGGNSGSAVIDVDTGEVVGLHFGGEYLKANYAVPAYELARDRRVVATGIKFGGAVGPTDEWEPAWIGAGAAEATPGAAAAPPVAGAVAPSLAAAAPVSAGGDGALHIPLDLRISIDVGAGAAAARAPGVVAGPTAQDGRISMRQLQEMMRDSHIDDAVLARYFTVNPAASKAFAPGVIPNPALVDVAQPADLREGAMMMSWANDLSRLRRQEKFKLRIAAGDRRPVLVSEGDSWFQFPVLLDDVIDNLGADYNVWSVDAAGDTLQNMVLDNAEYLTALRRNADSVRAFVFSGGGNDIVGDDAEGNPVISYLLRDFEAGRPASWYLENIALENKFRFIEECFRTVLSKVADAFPGLPVIVHGYDYAIPGGWPGDNRHPLWASNDRWLGKSMRERLRIEDPALQRDIIRLMIDRLNELQQKLCGGNNANGLFRNAWHVDARRVVDGRWADELHPTNEGFAAVASRFRDVLLRALGAPHESAAAMEATPNAADDAEAAREDFAAGRGAESLESVPQWRVCAALLGLRSQINQLAPRRDKRSDGTIGDAAHRTRDSDHNPWVTDGAMGVVTAMDITNDPEGGCNAQRLANAFEAGRDPRIKYVIWNRRIMSSRSINGAAPWTWRDYTGANPHRAHLHVSVLPDKVQYDSTSGWSITL